jgi:hypothetical protein
MEGPLATRVIGILPFSKEGQQDRDSVGLGIGKASALAAFEGKTVAA